MYTRIWTLNEGVMSMLRLLRQTIYCFALCCCALPVFGAEAAPEPIKSERLLEKLSMLLRGHAASPREQSAFKVQIESDPLHFARIYENAIDTFMKDAAYAQQIAKQHAIWWRVPGGSAAEHAGTIVAQDRPYSEIYSRSYIYINAAAAGFYRELGAKTLGDIPSSPSQPIFMPLAPDEERFRGFFASPEFLMTYPDTASNHNRKRSSQVFRIAFCETLQNNVQPRHAARSGDDTHAQNPDCVGCHQRLDPMARFFDRWAPSDAGLLRYDRDAPSRGAVHLGGTLGMERTFPGIADRDLGAIVVAQPEFGSCVAKLAWQFVFGSEVALPRPLLEQLEQRYGANPRLNSLVKTALLHPYFWSKAEVPALHYPDVKDILRNCGSCHAQAPLTRFDPQVYPFRTDSEANALLLGRIWRAINQLPGIRPMPEAPQPRLPLESIDSIRAWLLRGAADDRGAATLSDAQVEAIFE